MKIHFPLGSFVLGLSLFSYASYSIAQSSTRSETLPLSPVLSIQGHYQIQIQQAPTNQETQIQIKGDEQAIKALKIEGNQQQTSISSQNTRIPSSTPPLTLEIRTTGLKSLIAQGNSQIEISQVKVNQFNIKTQGNNKVLISDIQSKQFLLKTQGSIDATLSGNTTALGLDLSGNSTVNALALTANTAVIYSKGHSDIQVNVKEALERNLRGKTVLTIKGNPAISGQNSGMLELQMVKP